MYRKQVRRRRAVLVLLVVACLALISTYFSEGDDGPLHAVQRGVATIFGPVGEGADRALKPVRDMVSWFDETFEARGENEELRDELAAVRTELIETETAAEKAGYLERLDELTAEGELATFEPVEARPIGRSSSIWFSRMTIDAGSSSGVSPDDAVITADGLVGRVDAVSSNVAQVALITDGGNAVAARVAGKGPEGLVEANVGSPGSLVFGLIAGDKGVREGQRLVTAGFTDPNEELSSRFPPDIPIGEITEATATERQLRRQIEVEPFADLTDMDRVTVLTGGESS